MDELQAARRRRAEAVLDDVVDECVEILFAASTVTPDQRHKLRFLLRHYAKQAHPFRACVRDNMKRFGPGRTEAVCATLKDIIRGTTKWRNNPAMDHGAPGAVLASEPTIDDELRRILLSVTDDQIDHAEGILFSRHPEVVNA